MKNSFYLIILIFISISCDKNIHSGKIILINEQFKDTCTINFEFKDDNLLVERFELKFYDVRHKQKSKMTWIDSSSIYSDGLYRKISSNKKIVLPNQVYAHVLDFLWVPFINIDTFYTYSDAGINISSDSDFLYPTRYLTTFETDSSSKATYIVKRYAEEEFYYYSIYLNKSFGIVKLIYNDFENGERKYVISEKSKNDLVNYSENLLKNIK